MIACVIGTRPEAIKMAPVIRAIKALRYPIKVITTGQHDELLTQAMNDMEIKADFKLRRHRGDSTLSSFLGSLIKDLDKLFNKIQPYTVMAQGDTATVLAAATVCMMNRLPFGLVEAGLRTYNLKKPFPEEYNRRVASVGATWLFAATDSAYANLMQETIGTAHCYVTGNTVVDSIQWALLCKPPQLNLPHTVTNAPILVTCHRRETFGVPLWNVCQAIADFAREHKDREIWWPVHPNPDVQIPVYKRLGGISNIKLMEPQGYLKFINMMAASALIVTDSGGISEEVATLGKRALILRSATERPECLDTCCRLVGTDMDNVKAAIEETLKLDPLPRMVNPFGDGRAGSRIASTVVGHLRSIYGNDQT